MDTVKERTFPETLYVTEQIREYPNFGKELVGSEYKESLIPATEIETFVATYQLIRKESYKKTSRTEYLIEKIS